jgi:hypothetical protein
MNKLSASAFVSLALLAAPAIAADAAPAASAAAPATPPKVDSRFLQPLPLDFNEHDGWVSIFDGTLDGWDGDRRFWRAENGTIIGENSEAKPSGNSYLTYRKLAAHDFDLRLEIKVERSGGSGIQYRSRTGVPWRSKTPPKINSNVGPYNSATMLTGPQADFWYPDSPKTFSYNGQVFAENSAMGIQAWLGQVVRQYGPDQTKKKLVAMIAPPEQLSGHVKINDWNQYEIIARGGVFLHIINGQLMAVLIDDDPKSTNQLPGLFGLEIENITKVSARNLYVRKLN